MTLPKITTSGAFPDPEERAFRLFLAALEPSATLLAGFWARPDVDDEARDLLLGAACEHAWQKVGGDFESQEARETFAIYVARTRRIILDGLEESPREPGSDESGEEISRSPHADDAEDFNTLVQRAKEGDRAAMDAILNRIAPELRVLARPYADPNRRVGSTSDLLQEACLRAWLKLDSFEGGGADEETFRMFQSWIGTIVKRLGMNDQRYRKRQRRDPGPDRKFFRADSAGTESTVGEGGAVDPIGHEETPSQVLSEKERSEIVRRRLEGLEDRLGARIVRLRFFEGLNLKQIARKLKLSYDQTRKRYHAAMRVLEGGLSSIY